MSLYHALPGPLRSAAATCRGYQVRRWRYGPETPRLVEEALARERWSAQQWRRYREERLARLLHLAATQVPYYRDLWQERRRRGDRRSWEELANWPVLPREPVRAHPERFLVEGPRPPLTTWDTSGSNGTPVKVWRSRALDRHWFALFEARWRGWHGVSRHDRWGTLGGRTVVPPARDRPPFWVWNGGMRQLYMSVFHNTPEFARHTVEAIRRTQLRYLYGYPSSLAYLARAVLEQELEPPELAVAISNAEMLYPHQREVIERAFHCPVRNTYGMAEGVAAAGECEHGGFHLWPDVGVVEALAFEEDRAVPPGEIGRLVCTGLLSEVMPLIRYEVGDRGALAPAERACACGRTLPLLESLDGRISEALYTADGRVVYRLAGISSADIPLREAQMIQEEDYGLRYRFVPGQGFTEAHAEELVRRIRERFGDLPVRLEPLEQLPRGPRGKYTYMISRVNGPPPPRG